MDELKIDELLESTYYFCLNKLGDPDSAEDLTQEILLEALASKGKNINK